MHATRDLLVGSMAMEGDDDDGDTDVCQYLCEDDGSGAATSGVAAKYVRRCFLH